jgi:hypothetical protein
MVIGYGAIAMSKPKDFFEKELTRLSFYVAGVRFCKVAGVLKPNDEVSIVPENFHGRPCYSILSKSHVQIGYVPQSLVQAVGSTAISRSYLSSVNQHAVPWKRYEVTILLGRA